MRVVIIGGTGHVGTYLVPKLVEAGYEVISVSRQHRVAYESHVAWKSVQEVRIDRARAEQAGTFGHQIRELAADVVIDMICFTLGSVKQLVESFRGEVRHFLHCGSIWVHGHSVQIPTMETQPRHPFGEYGLNKAAVEAYLLAESQRTGFPATILHPGHIVGRGWVPLNPVGNFNSDAFVRLSSVPAEAVRPYLDLEFFTTVYRLLTEAEKACCGADRNALLHVRREWIPVYAAIYNMWPRLERQLPKGRKMPFDRDVILRRYADSRYAVLEQLYCGKIPAKIKKDVEKDLSKCHQLPGLEHSATQSRN